MKTLLSVMFVLVVAALASARATPPSVTSSATQMEEIGQGLMRLSGDVKITIAVDGTAIEITADEADVNAEAREMTLKGRVTLKLPASIQ